MQLLISDCFALSLAAHAQNSDTSAKFADVEKEFQSLAKKYDVKTKDLGIYATDGEGGKYENFFRCMSGKKSMIPRFHQQSGDGFGGPGALSSRL